VTHADPDYEGSASVDTTLLRAAQMHPYEQVHIWNITQGTRIITYLIEGPADSGVVCINGAAALLNKPGDLVIISAFAEMEEAELVRHTPRVVHVDEQNRIVDMRAEIPGPQYPPTAVSSRVPSGAPD